MGQRLSSNNLRKERRNGKMTKKFTSNGKKPNKCTDNGEITDKCTDNGEITDKCTSNVLGQNLLENPSFDTSSLKEKQSELSVFNTSPWQITSEGDGFLLEMLPQGSSVLSQSPWELDCTHCIAGCDKGSSRIQIIDLQSKGFHPTSPHNRYIIKAHNWVYGHPDFDGTAFMTVSLLNTEKKVIEDFHYESGHVSACHSKWQKIECCFENLPTDVRFVRFEDGCQGSGDTKAHTGPKIAGSTVKMLKVWKDGTFQTGNLLENASFTPISWQPNRTTTNIDYSKWQADHVYELQQLKDACGEYNPNDWCIATSGHAKRTQMINLTDYCSEATLDGVNQPRIEIKDSFQMVPDYFGSYSVGAELWNEDYMIIRESGWQGAPATTWGTGRTVFKNYGPGIRYLLFTEECTLNDKDVSGFVGLKIHNPSVSFLPGNILRNNVFLPNTDDQSWKDQVHNGEADVHPWNIVSGAYQLEKVPHVNKRIGSNGHCVTSVSMDWFIRHQEIDLVASGYEPEYIDKHRPPIKVFEWFAARKGCVGVGYIKIELKDERHQSLNVTFYSGEKVFSSCDWAKICFVLQDYPKGVRYISFEDGGRGLERCHGHFGPKMIGAEVIVG